jgi:hypothetical protein
MKKYVVRGAASMATNCDGMRNAVSERGVAPQSPNLRKLSENILLGLIVFARTIDL